MYQLWLRSADGSWWMKGFYAARDAATEALDNPDAASYVERKLTASVSDPGGYL